MFFQESTLLSHSLSGRSIVAMKEIGETDLKLVLWGIGD